MSNEKEVASSDDPLQVLGLPRNATEQQVRQRYLELVREFPPERDPVRFQQIYAAYKSIEDPLMLANRLLIQDDDPPRNWDDILNEQKAKPPRLSVDVLLSLGNQTSANQTSGNQPITSEMSDE